MPVVDYNHVLAKAKASTQGIVLNNVSNPTALRNKFYQHRKGLQEKGNTDYDNLAFRIMRGEQNLYITKEIPDVQTPHGEGNDPTVQRTEGEAGHVLP